MTALTKQPITVQELTALKKRNLGEIQTYTWSFPFPKCIPENKKNPSWTWWSLLRWSSLWLQLEPCWVSHSTGHLVRTGRGVLQTNTHTKTVTVFICMTNVCDYSNYLLTTVGGWILSTNLATDGSSLLWTSHRFTGKLHRDCSGWWRGEAKLHCLRP